MEGASGVRIIHKSRDERRRGASGGVAFAFGTSSCNFKKRAAKV